MTRAEPAPGRDPDPPRELARLPRHTERIRELKAAIAELESASARLSTGRLVSFLAGVVLLVAGVRSGAAWGTGGGVLCFVAFAALVVSHGRLIARERVLRSRLAVHERHVARVTMQFGSLALPRADLYPPDHDYAWDIDVAGPASLLHWLDTTHTREGERTLAAWLGAGADVETIRARQTAVRELASMEAFRESLEAMLASAEAPKKNAGKLDGAPFLTFTELPSYFARAPWMLASMWAVPLATLGLAVAAQWTSAVPASAWMVSALAAGLLTLTGSGHAQQAFELVAQRRGYMDAFYEAFCLVERTEFQAPELRRLREAFFIGGEPPSVHFRTLDRWAGLAEMRTQFPLHLMLNVLLLWDFHVLHGLERWNRRAGQGLAAVFRALGELEALASLATLADLDPAATFPAVEDGAPRLQAEALGHPLIRPDIRVHNDVRLAGEGALLVITGSNMAGKSTLLRALGVNLALALAGGPVVAKDFTVSPMRLRASMRANDSLERGASYFHAELTKLKGVTRDLETGAPVFFLLDELLRGTNTKARIEGARAVIAHLVRRRALGVVATHDFALADFEERYPGRAENAHFTDTMRDGEMIFDYRLRPGVVQTSNALELLRRAGIDVPTGT